MTVRSKETKRSVQITGYDSLAALDLVPHFLGIAKHDNQNATPAHKTTVEVTSRAVDG